jgi:hypothetical protein
VRQLNVNGMMKMEQPILSTEVEKQIKSIDEKLQQLRSMDVNILFASIEIHK